MPRWTTRDSGHDALRLAEAAGIEPIPWQNNAVLDICAETGEFDEKLEWAATAAGLIVARQNGKGGVLEIRALAGVILFGERRILWTAHSQKTATDAHQRMSEIFDSSPELRKRLKPSRNNGITLGNGNHAIRLKGGAEILFFTRSPNAGRGLWADCLFLDEALDLPDNELGILRYTLRTSAMRTGRRAQTIYASTPPDEEKHPNAIVMARLRKRALAGNTRTTVWIEHSVPERADPDSKVDERLAGEALWPLGNPSLGYLFDLGTLRGDLEESGEREFLVEGLAAPDYWPDPDGRDAAESAFDVEVWKSRRDRSSRALDPVALGLEVSARGIATLSVAGWRVDGRKHGEQIWSGPAAAAVGVLLKIVEKVDPATLVVDGRGKAGSLLPEIRAKGLDPQVLTSIERSQADEALVRDVVNDELRLPGVPMPELDAAVEAATWREYGDVKFFDRRTGGAGISPLVSLSLARHGLLTVAAQPVKKTLPTARVVKADAAALAAVGAGDLSTVGF